MKINKYKLIFDVLVSAALAFVIHKILFLFSVSPVVETGFRYPIFSLYLIFLFCSLTIVLILLQVNKKNKDSVGQTFLLLTCIKMGIAYVLLYPILQSTHELITTEKLNFFIIFALFLTIETLMTIRILNIKQ